MRENGLNLRVTSNSRQGGRKYMEDVVVVHFEESKDKNEVLFSYFAIFDGHGGVPAANYAKQHLLQELKNQKGFWSNDDEDVLNAIKIAFRNTHRGMWKVFGSWPKTSSGMPSTSGTTASIVVLRNTKIYIGHVGDSGIVLGYQDDDTAPFKVLPLTEDHKPESPEELKRIEEVGGAVATKAGVQRVVWNRPKPDHKGPVRRSTQIDQVPFLAVARSLGDLWSYNFVNEEFVVSPEPDVSVHKLDPARHRCIILGSDGLWNMLKPHDAVQIVEEVERETEDKVLYDIEASPNYWINPSITLVDIALQRWRLRTLKADNTSCITVMIDPPGLSKSHILKKQRAVNLGYQYRRQKCKAVKKETTASQTDLDSAGQTENIDCVNETDSNPSPILESKKQRSISDLSPSTVSDSVIIDDSILIESDTIVENSSLCRPEAPQQSDSSVNAPPVTEELYSPVSTSEVSSENPSLKETSNSSGSHNRHAVSPRTVAGNITNKTGRTPTLRSEKACIKAQTCNSGDPVVQASCSGILCDTDNNNTNNAARDLSPALLPCIWPDIANATDSATVQKMHKKKCRSTSNQKSFRQRQDQNSLDLDVHTAQNNSKTLKRKRASEGNLHADLPFKKSKRARRTSDKPMTRFHVRHLSK